MKVDDVIQHAESDLVQWGLARLLAQFAFLSTAVSIPIIGPLVSIALTKIVECLVKGMDALAYYKYKAVHNGVLAEAYQDDVYANIKATENGDVDEINRTWLARKASFDKLMSLSY